MLAKNFMVKYLTVFMECSFPNTCTEIWIVPVLFSNNYFFLLTTFHFGTKKVDPDLNLVKGRGGALLREKMVEAASGKFIVVVDETKLVTGLGGSGLAMPVEVVQFCWKYNQVRLQGLFNEEGCEAKLRLDDNGKPYVTDNSNYIVDLYFKTPIKDALAAGKEISALEGVVEHGLFLDMASSVIIAGTDGVSVKTK